MTNPLALLTSLLVLIGGQTPSAQQDEGRTLFGNISVASGLIVFSYAGDLWLVEVDGGAATRLTTGPEEDDYPSVSPDGLHIAFSRRSADDWDVYVVPVSGGEARQLTYNPEADIARGWTPDGSKVLFMSHRDEELVFRLYTIPRSGGFPTPLPLPRAWNGSYAPGGDRIAYVPWGLPRDLFGLEWRYYRGGQTSPIWIAEIKNSSVQKLPRENSNDRQPMWLGDKIFFVSDRSGTFNLHSYNAQTRALEQLTTYESYGIESAAAAQGIIAFVQDGRLRVYDLQTASTRTLDVEIEPDRSELAARTVSGERWVQSAAPSANGDRVVLGFRGEVVTLDSGTGAYRNLTQTSDAAERYPVISPDGRWVAYLSDESGEYELRVRRLDGAEPARKIPIELKPSFYRELVWSPDSKRLAFTDKRLTLWVADIETGGARRVSTSEYSHQDLYQPAWSPDGQTLAYSSYGANRQRTVYLYDVSTTRRVSVTDGSVSAEHPTFDRNGKYLYFVASGTAVLSDFGWSVLSGRLFEPLASRRIHLVLLREGYPAPVMPYTGEVNPQADSLAARPARRPDALPGPGRPPGNRPAPTPRSRGQRAETVIDAVGIESRIVRLPLPARDYAGLAAGEAGQLYVLVRESAATREPGTAAAHSLHRYELASPRSLTKLIDDLDEFSLAADGSQLLYRHGSAWHLVSTADTFSAGQGRLNLDSLSIEVDPAVEWRQIYRESWRLMRDFFYDPNHHGQNLVALERHYASYLPSVVRRRDLNTLIDKALGHVSVSHLGIAGGDMPRPIGEGAKIGLLGADYEIVEGQYRIKKIYRSGHFSSANPLWQAPLDQPGVFVNEGDFLLAVDEKPISAQRNLYAQFAGTARRPVTIKVAASADGRDARTYTVVPLPGENSLRRVNWAEVKRRFVAEETQGVLGYVWVPNFGARGVETILQQLLASSDKRGLIIDQRFAPGGITSDYLIELLQRHPLYYYTFREGVNLGVPTNALPSAKVLLINDVNASAAETFALMFKLGNLGKIVGTRTMGAGIGGYAFIPQVIDGGWLSIPNRAAFDPAGNWAIENVGIEPDVEVELDPSAWLRGADPQLETAINTVLQAIVDRPPPEVKKPAYPVHKQ